MSAGDGDEDFSTGAELSLTVADSELSAIRTQIERELADIPIGVDASVSGGGRMQPRDPASGQFMSIEGVEQRVIEQTEAQVELLDDIKDELEAGGIPGGIGGGGGGGGGGINIGRLGALGGGFAAGSAGLGVGGTAAAFGGILGAGVGAGLLGRAALDQLFPDARGTGIISGTSVAQEPGNPVLEVPDNYPPELQVPDSLPPELQVPEGIPPELQAPEGFPPELQTPADFPPEIRVPENFPPELQPPTGQWPPQLDIPDAPGWARDLINIFGGPSGPQIDVSATVDRSIDASVDFLPNPQEIIDDVLAEVEPEIEDAEAEINNLRRQLENALGL